jgi:hypothetical protein
MSRSGSQFVLAALVATSLAGAGCSDDPLLSDRDTGSDAPQPDAGTDAGAGDAGPPPADAGPACVESDPVAPADPTMGAWAERFANPGVDGELPNVNALAFAADGTVYVGGEFSSAGYLAVQNIASWDGGTGWRAMGEGLNGRVRALAVDPTGRVWAAYAPDDGWEATRIARFEGGSWTTITDAVGAIEALEFVDGELFVVGSFTSIGDAPWAGAARFDGTDWSGFTGLAPDGAIHAIEVSGTEICLGGSFQTVGIIEARSVACFDGATWTARSLPLEHYLGVYDLAHDPADGTLVAAGEFMLDETGENGGSIARWQTDHWALIGRGVMTEIGPGSTRQVRNIAFTSGGMLIAGAFQLVDAAEPRPAHGVARWDGTRWSDLGGLFPEVGFSLPSSNVWAMGLSPDGSAYFGGLFTQAGTLRVAHVVRWDGTYWSALRTPGESYEGVSGSVFALARHGTCSIYVGGDFTYAGEVRANNIARYTLEGGYEALGHGVIGNVQDIAITRDEIVYAVGGFVGGEDGTEVQGIGAFDGARWRPLNDGLAGMVWSVALHEPAAPDGNTLVYAAGDFAASGDLPLHQLARWDGSSWTDLGVGMTGFPNEFDPTMENATTLYEVILDPETGDVIIGGNFAAIGTGDARVETANVARWDGTRWHAYGDGLGDTYGSVLSLALWNGDLVAGGAFTTSGETTVSHVARWNGTAWEPVGTSGPDGYTISALAPVGDSLFVGGVFSLGEGSHIAIFRAGEWHPLNVGVNDLVEALVDMNEGVYVGGTFTRSSSAPAVGVALWRFAE